MISPPQNKTGFTLIELVVTILLISILAVSVVPRIFDTSDVTNIGKRDHALNLLRTVQQRAMQNTQTSVATCHRILFFDDYMGLSASPANGSGCALPAATVSVSGTTQEFLIVDELDSLEATNSSGTVLSTLDFDSWGRPTPNTGDCSGAGCVVEVNGLSLCVESQGYIHDCS